MPKRSKYNQRQFDRVMEHFAKGEGLTSICESYSWAPDAVSNIYYWAKRSAANAETYAHARKSHAAVLAEETLKIADNDPDPIRARVRIQARQWLAAKYDRETYGDKVDVGHVHTIDLKAAIEQAKARLEGSA